MAKNYLHQIIRSGASDEQTKLAPRWYISTNNIPRSHLNLKKLYQHAWKITAEQYWEKKYNWPRGTMETIDWEARYKAVKNPHCTNNDLRHRSPRTIYQ